MTNIKLDHCVIHISEWERSNAFYRDVLGAEVVKQGPRTAYRFGDTQLNLHGPGVTGGPVAKLPCALNGMARSAARSSTSSAGPCPSRKGRLPDRARRGRAPASIFVIPTVRCSSSSRIGELKR